METRVLFAEPQPLTWGKSALAQVEVNRTRLPSLREFGHRGYAIEAYCWDSCHIQAMARRTMQWHCWRASEWGDESSVHTCADMLWLRELIFVCPCAVHLAQTGLQWGLWIEFRSKDILRDAFIGIQSLLNSFDLLTEHLATWLTTHFSFHNPWSQVECEQWRLLWIALGLDAETAEHFAYDLQIQWCCA